VHEAEHSVAFRCGKIREDLFLQACDNGRDACQKCDAVLGDFELHSAAIVGIGLAGDVAFAFEALDHAAQGRGIIADALCQSGLIEARWGLVCMPVRVLAEGVERGELDGGYVMASLAHPHLEHGGGMLVEPPDEVARHLAEVRVLHVFCLIFVCMLIILTGARSVTYLICMLINLGANACNIISMVSKRVIRLCMCPANHVRM
jgi:hypothetical protein